MNLRKEVIMFVMIGVAIFIPLITIVAEEGTAGSPDSISKRISEIFAKADELSKWRKQRVREYLSSLTDEELAQVYSNAGGRKRLSLDVALEAVQKDRKQVVNWLPRALNEEDQAAYQKKYEGLVDELAALGTKAVPILASRTGYDYMKRGHYGMAREALCRIGRTDIAPIIALMDSDNGFVRANAAYALSRLVDPHAKDALLKALDDTYGPVHACALTGLIELGPALVGDSTLVTCLIDGLQDWTCIDESIQGLERYGDEAAIEALEVIERFWPGRGKQNYRYRARQAINAIQRRAGKAVKEVRREDYSTEISRDELLSAVEHPNAAIRWMAVRMAVEYMGSHGRDCSKINEIVDLLIKRIKQENDPDVLLQIATNLRWLMTLAGESSKSAVSPGNLQKALEASLSVLDTYPMFASNVRRDRKVSARIQDLVRPERVELLAAAIRGAGIVLDAAHKHEMRLD